MKIRIITKFHTNVHLDILAISGGMSLENNSVTIHTNDKDSLLILRNNGFAPINEIMDYILTRKIEMLDEPSIVGFVTL